MRFMNWLRSEQSEFTFLVESQLPPSSGHSMTNRAVAKAGIYHFFVSLEPQVAFNLMSSTPLPRTGFYPGQKAAFA